MSDKEGEKLALSVKVTITIPCSIIQWYLQYFTSFMVISKVCSSVGARESSARVRMFWTLNSIWYVVVNLYGVASPIAR